MFRLHSISLKTALAATVICSAQGFAQRYPPGRPVGTYNAKGGAGYPGTIIIPTVPVESKGRSEGSSAPSKPSSEQKADYSGFYRYSSREKPKIKETLDGGNIELVFNGTTFNFPFLGEGLPLGSSAEYSLDVADLSEAAIEALTSQVHKERSASDRILSLYAHEGDKLVIRNIKYNIAEYSVFQENWETRFEEGEREIQFPTKMNANSKLYSFGRGTPNLRYDIEVVGKVPQCASVRVEETDGDSVDLGNGEFSTELKDLKAPIGVFIANKCADEKDAFASVTLRVEAIHSAK